MARLSSLAAFALGMAGCLSTEVLSRMYWM
jgi:hypothetical protein